MIIIIVVDVSERTSLNDCSCYFWYQCLLCWQAAVRASPIALCHSLSYNWPRSCLRQRPYLLRPQVTSWSPLSRFTKSCDCFRYHRCLSESPFPFSLSLCWRRRCSCWCLVWGFEHLVSGLHLQHYCLAGSSLDFRSGPQSKRYYWSNSSIASTAFDFYWKILGWESGT